MTTKLVRNAPFDFAPGELLARKYEVVARVGSAGGATYRLSERATGIERTARFFHPRLDPTGRLATACARKLHKLRHCDILVPYRTQETISVDGRDVTFLVHDVVRGNTLDRFLAQQTGGRLPIFEGLHLLHAVASGLEAVHAAGEAHGAVTPGCVIVRRKGLGFAVKLLDVTPDRIRLQDRSDHQQLDVRAMLRLFADAVGGRRAFAKLPAKTRRELGAGLLSPTAHLRFADAGDLRRYLETLKWR